MISSFLTGTTAGINIKKFQRRYNNLEIQEVAREEHKSSLGAEITNVSSLQRIGKNDTADG